MPEEGFSSLWQSNGFSWSPDRSDVISLLTDAEITDCHLIQRGSNYTFLVTLSSHSAGQSPAIYKPRSGERPLYDFPANTLYKREYAAYIVSEALGWHMVPPTVIRDGPHGVGSLQLFIEADQNIHYFMFQDRRVEEAKRIAVFDYITNNADRKAGHCLEGFDGRVWLIDNGLTFNSEPKLRTVIWDFQGEAIPEELAKDVEKLRDVLTGPSAFREELSKLISGLEMKAFQKRLETIIQKPVFPSPGYYRSVPWPPV